MCKTFCRVASFFHRTNSRKFPGHLYLFQDIVVLENISTRDQCDQKSLFNRLPINQTFNCVVKPVEEELVGWISNIILHFVLKAWNFVH